MGELKKEKPWVEFPYQDYKRRHEKAKELMEKYGIDGLILFVYENWAYYLGWRATWRLNYFRGAVVPREGEPVYIAPGEIDRAIRAHSWIDRVIPWEEQPNPPWEKSGIKKMVDSVKELGLANKTIGVELGIGMYFDGASYSEFERLKKNLPDAKFVDATDMIWEQRRIKTPWEIKTMRKLGGITAKGFKAALEFIKEGVTEREIHEVAWKTFVKEGAHDSPMSGCLMMRAGERRNTPCSRATDYKMKKGDQILLDGGPSYKGYFSDVQRAAVIGEPSEKVKKHAKQGEVGYEAAMEILKPGTKISSLYKVPIQAMKKANPEAINPYTHMGHGIGLRMHEPPWLTEDATGVLEPGMVITVETAGYDLVGNLETGWTIRTIGNYPEDHFLITEDGFENLSGGCPWKLWVR